MLKEWASAAASVAPAERSLQSHAFAVQPADVPKPLSAPAASHLAARGAQPSSEETGGTGSHTTGRAALCEQGRWRVALPASAGCPLQTGIRSQSLPCSPVPWLPLEHSCLRDYSYQAPSHALLRSICHRAIHYKPQHTLPLPPLPGPLRRRLAATGPPAPHPRQQRP